MRGLRGALIVAAMGLVLMPSLASAQATAITGQIQGTVVDASGGGAPWCQRDGR